MKRRIGGITMIGFLLVLVVGGFLAYLVMRLVPLYVEYFGVVKSMEQVRMEPNAAQLSLYEIKRNLSLKFNVQYVDDLPPNAITLRHEKGAVVLNIHYERRVHFVYNIDLVATFDKSVNLSSEAIE